MFGLPRPRSQRTHPPKQVLPRCVPTLIPRTHYGREFRGRKQKARAAVSVAFRKEKMMRIGLSFAWSRSRTLQPGSRVGQTRERRRCVRSYPFLGGFQSISRPPLYWFAVAFVRFAVLVGHGLAVGGTSNWARRFYYPSFFSQICGIKGECPSGFEPGETVSPDKSPRDKAV